MICTFMDSGIHGAGSFAVIKSTRSNKPDMKNARKERVHSVIL